MIKCPNCREITITKNISGYFVCSSCGVEWKDDTMNKHKPKCGRCNSTAVVADFYDFDSVTMRCEDCDYIWDETILEGCLKDTSIHVWDEALERAKQLAKIHKAYTEEQDMVNHPHHYANGMTTEVECIMFTRWLDFDLGNAFKYVWRAGNKDDAKQDIEKAIWYLEDAEAYDMSCGEIKLLNFLPKSALPEWKYTALRSILLGNIDDALCSLHEQLGKTAHNNRKR